MANGHGGARPGSGPKPTPLNMSRVMSLRKQGISQAEIGRRFGVSVDVIRLAIKREERQQCATNSESKQ